MVEIVVPTIAEPSAFEVHAAPSKIAADLLRGECDTAGCSVEALDSIVCASNTPDLNNPGLISVLLKELNLVGRPGLQLQQMACGALHAIVAAERSVALGRASVVGVVLVDLLGRFFTGQEIPDDAHVREAANELDNGAAVLLVRNGSDRTPAPFIVPRSAVATRRVGGAAARSFECPFPQANRFPVRLTLEDFRAGGHLPRLNGVSFIAAVKPLVRDLLNGVSPELPIVLHAPSCGELTQYVKSIHGGPVYGGTAVGYRGAAGPVVELAAHRPSLVGREVMLMTVSPGITVSTLRVEVR